MTLPITANLPTASPCPASEYGDDALHLRDHSATHGLLHVQGPAAPGIVDEVFTPPPIAPGDVSRVENFLLSRLRPDLFLLLSERSAAADRLAELWKRAAEHPVAITDITHGRGILRISGQLAPAMLPKLCGLDFHEEAFPDLHAAQTSYAKTKTLIIRGDAENTPGYYLIVERSLAAYVWEATVDAMNEFLGGGS